MLKVPVNVTVGENSLILTVAVNLEEDCEVVIERDLVTSLRVMVTVSELVSEMEAVSPDRESVKLEEIENDAVIVPGVKVSLIVRSVCVKVVDSVLEAVAERVPEPFEKLRD